MGNKLTITLPRQTMLEILDGEFEGGEVIKNEIIDNSRWSIQHRIIFKYQDKFYEAYYSVGATEHQEEGPWEYEEEVECTEVREVEKTIKVFEPVLRGESND